MNGEFVPWTESQVPLSTHGLHYGTGVFEGIRTYPIDGDASVFRLDDHLERLHQSAEIYGLQIAFSTEQLKEAIDGLLRRNHLTEAYVRPIAYMGGESLGIRAQCSTQTAILAWPFSPPGAKSSRRSARLTISPYRKIDRQMVPTTAKACGQYVNSRLAAMDAMRRGFDEALLLNTEGDVAEASVANIFVVKDGSLRTNDERASILMGITRDSVLQLAAAEGLRTEIGTLAVADLESVSEMFLCGTACEILPIAELDGRRIGRLCPGPVTERIGAAFDRAKTGALPAWSHWLHRVAMGGVPASADSGRA